MLKKLAILATIGAIPLALYAQKPAVVVDQNPFDNGDSIAQKPAWSQFKLPNKKIDLNFKNASPDTVLAFFTKASGITIIKDPTLNTPISLVSAKSVSLSDAFNILNETLKLRGFELKKQGNLMVAGAKQQQMRFNIGDLAGRGARPPEVILHVYPIQFASASAVAKTLNDVFGDTSQGGGGFPFGRGGFGRVQILGGPGGNNNNNNQPAMHASADDYSNSVIVSAPQDVQDQVANLLKSIDKETPNPFISKVYELKYASSDDLAPIVQNIMSSNAPTGRGNTASTQGNPFQNLLVASRFGGASLGNVVSEPKTNSLVVTGTPENQTIVENVIKSLDKPIKFEDSAIVIPLNSAKADQVAYVINQAFQSKVANTQSSQFTTYGQGTGGTSMSGLGRFTQGGGSSAPRPGTSPTGLSDPTGTGVGGALALNQGGSAAAQLGGVAPGAQQGGVPPLTNDAAAANLQNKELAAEQQSLAAALGEPNIDPTALETSIAVQGGFFNQILRGGQQGAGSSAQGSPTQTRDPNGNIINQHNLNGNVTVIPDVNSNSIIVVTSPENMQLLRNVIDQLDRTPPQVMIETIIMEATLDKTDKFGVEWNYLAGKLGSLVQNLGVQSGINAPNSTVPPGFNYTIDNGKLNAFLQAVSQDSRFKILETPRIFAENNVEAEINVSQQIPYQTATIVSSTGTTSSSFAFLPVGVVLDIQPQITANGMVNLAILQTANEFVSFTSFNAPVVNQRSANTMVSVKDGDTIVLGGIMGDTKTATVNKVPLLGDLPIIGNLFRSTSHQNTRTELLIFLTPHIVNSPEDAQRLRSQTEQEMKAGSRPDVEKIIKDQKTTTNPPKEGGH